jgi:hypothetical protein
MGKGHGPSSIDCYSGMVNRRISKVWFRPCEIVWAAHLQHGSPRYRVEYLLQAKKTALGYLSPRQFEW